MDLNKATLIGNLTRDPESKTTPNGQNVCSFGVATNLVWTDTNGEKQTRAEFHNIVAWRKLAEICGQYLKKGNKVYIEGRLQTRTWEDKDSGKKMYRTEIVADNMIMLGAKGDGGGGGTSNSAPSNEGSQPEPPAAEDEIQVENIPF